MSSTRISSNITYQVYVTPLAASARLVSKYSLPQLYNGLFDAYQKQGEGATADFRFGSCVCFVMTGSVSQSHSPNPLHESIFVSENDPVYDVPMNVIHRPLQSFTEEGKVSSRDTLLIA